MSDSTTDMEKVLHKIQYHFMIQTLNNQEGKRNFLNLIKGTFEKLTVNIILDGERLNIFPLRSRTRQGCLLSSLQFNLELQVLDRANRKEASKHPD